MSDPPGNPNASHQDSVACDATVQSCAVRCPPDFILTAPCWLIKVNGGSVQMSAGDLPDYPAGTYSWTTSSNKITLNNPNTSTVTVVALATPSASRDAEVITVTRTAAGCPPIVKTVNVTVAKVTFSVSANQRYGYDNYDTPADPLDDHVSIKKSDYTFVNTTIEGGAVGTDFNFVCDDATICAPVVPGGAAASFDLRLNGGSASNTMATVLHAKCKCPDATSFTQLAVHVYKEKAVDVVVAKIDNPAGANLRFPTADYGSHTADANAKLKEAVVKYNISNYQDDNSVTRVALASGNGVVSYDIANGGGTDLTAISAAMTGTGTKVRVAIIKDMKSYYYLAAATVVGATTLTLTAAANAVFYASGHVVPLGTGANQEMVTITAVAGNVITCNALTKVHGVGEPMEFYAGGWGCNPILIMEGSASLDVAKWTVLHEVGHRGEALDLRDIIDATDFMHFQQSWTDYRLRYCPRLKKYPAGTADTENQWQQIPR